MKKKAYIIFSLLTLVLVGCEDKKSVNAFIVYKVDDSCISMGAIVGEERQTCLVGDYTTEVIASAKKGYVFIMWSDGYKEANRSDKVTGSVFTTYFAFFEAINE